MSYGGEEGNEREWWKEENEERKEEGNGRGNREGERGDEGPTGPSLGFGAGEPWLPQPDGYAGLAASLQAADPDSTLELYRDAIAIRRERLVGEDRFERIDLGSDVVAFDRGPLSCIVNMGPSPVRLPADRDVVLASHPSVDTELPPDCAVWLG